ncbi:hypothetical protein BDR26DRAFT_861954 [Obelidium mucronatum]|nr:hypothetical protein BDR26DRAFT_861954 [Obelidium mucronatum]
MTKLLLLSLLASFVFASQHVLTNKQSSNSPDLSALTSEQLKEQGFRLIETGFEGNSRWMHQGDILKLYQTETRFTDLTDGDLDRVAHLPPPKRFPIPAKLLHQAVVNPLLANVSVPHLTEWLTKFTSFKTRYYQSPSGKESAEWLFTQASVIAKKADKSKVKVTIEKFEHEWAQFSVLVKIHAVEGGVAEPAVVISAHQDSTNQWNPWWGAAPGADDDGSGSCTIFEAYRVIIESGFIPYRPIEFHWYSAEEAGLLGSQKVVADYKARGVQVAGVFHADMTGYTPEDKEEVIGISTDYVDDELEGFVKQLVQTYNKGTKIIDTECGYGCSDHASWTKAGYPASFTFETAFKESSPYIHSPNDVVEHITFSHVAKFTRIAIGFAVELSYTK